MKQPLIGITADSEQPGGYSKFPWYALRQNYCSAVRAAGGVPIVLPHEPSLADHYLGLIDGLVVSGGAFDVDPSLFGAATRHATVSLKEGRTDFELRMTQGVLAAAALQDVGLEVVPAPLQLDWRSDVDDYGPAVRAAVA